MPYKHLTQEILKIKRSKPLIIAIDGIDGSGKTHFAQNLQKHLKAQKQNIILIHIDDFHNAKKIRYQKGPDSPKGFYRDSYNYTELKKVLLDPFKYNTKNTFKTKILDVDTDQTINQTELKIPHDCILIVEGIFLHRKELSNYWDYSIFLDINFDTALSRNISRSKDINRIGTKNKIIKRYKARYIPGQQIYFKEENPQQKANIVIDNNDYYSPFINKPKSPPKTR